MLISNTINEFMLTHMCTCKPFFFGVDPVRAWQECGSRTHQDGSTIHERVT